MYGVSAEKFEAAVSGLCGVSCGLRQQLDTQDKGSIKYARSPDHHNETSCDVQFCAAVAV
jgi:hypothetical protein